MTPKNERLVPLDWLRGLVMVLMILDHASQRYNLGRITDDSALFWDGQTSLPTEQFLVRWVTHLCAPTFVFLAGTSAALSFFRRQGNSELARQFDRDLLIRGTFILLVELIYMTILWGFVLQVLYAIAVGMILLVPLRRLSSRTLAIGSILWFLGGELVTGWLWPDPSKNASHIIALLVAVRDEPHAILLYAAIPWAAMMTMGWAAGHYLHSRRQAGLEALPVLPIVGLGLGSIVLFLVVRGLDGYGNMFLHRDDNPLIHWLHTSKYPPSLSFVALEFGIMFLLLAGFAWVHKRVRVRPNGPLLVFGQTAMFFYLLHIPVLRIPGEGGMGLLANGELQTTFIATAWGLVAMYPLCLWYRNLKRRYPKSVLRFI